MRAKTIVLGSIALVVLLLPACGGGEEPTPKAVTPTTTPTPSPSVEQTEIEATPTRAIPADVLFSQEPPGYKYERDREVEKLYESQFEMIFARGPAELELHSVAARRVLDDAGEVQGSILTVSVELADASLIPKFQQGLLSGLGEGLREIEIGSTPAFYKENFTENGQDVIVFFHEGTLAVEAFGVTPKAAKEVAAALVERLTE